MPNVPITCPSWLFERPRSLRMSPPAVARFCRAMYVIRHIRHSRPRTTVGADGRLRRMPREPNIRSKVKLVIAIALLAVTLTAGQRTPQVVRSQLVWVDRAGKKLSTVSDLADFGNIELSPDRRQIAAAVLNDQTGQRELWLYDAADGHKRRVDDTIADENWLIWSPDGKRIAYNSQRTRGLDLYGRDVGAKQETLPATD